MSKSTLFTLFIAGLLTFSCSEKMDSTVETTTNSANTQEETKYAEVSNEVIDDYIALKNALVETDQDAASAAGEKLVTTLKNYNLDDQTAKLSASIVSATEHAESMIGSDIEKQRENFEELSANITEIVEMTGSNIKLYQQFCPMYGDDGAAWLSKEEKIRNPYFGSEMMNCGSVQKEIN